MVTKWGHYITSLLLTAFFLLSAMSCSDRSGHIRSALAAADSLMMTQPQAALDTLMSIDSSDAGKLSRADKAFYTLLHTEAEYKCYLPVAENTAIAEAAYVKDSFGVTVYSSALPANGMEYDYDSYFTKMKELVPSKTQELNILYHSNKVRRSHERNSSSGIPPVPTTSE